MAIDAPLVGHVTGSNCRSYDNTSFNDVARDNADATLHPLGTTATICRLSIERIPRTTNRTCDNNEELSFQWERREYGRGIAKENHVLTPRAYGVSCTQRQRFRNAQSS